ncbi:hypothetical protein FRC10_001561, partial [Ceratobasidium sp. 414]
MHSHSPVPLGIERAREHTSRSLGAPIKSGAKPALRSPAWFCRWPIEAEVRGSANAPHPPPTISAPTTQANLALRRAVDGDACTPDVLLTLLFELPPKDDIAALFDIYFRDINPVRLPLPENDVRRAFDDLNAFTWGPPREDGDKGATHILFLPLLFMIIATTTFCLPLVMSKRIDVKSQAKRYYHSYRCAAAIASLLPATTIVCARLLAARFLVIIRTPADGWYLGATLRLAQALGLHRDGARLSLPAADTERRRRLWAHLFYTDASMCLRLGRPTGVRVGDCNVLPPGSVKLEGDAEDEVGECTHGERPTRWTFIALRHRLARIVARVIEHFQDLAGGRRYDTVIELDRELVAFSESLPALYKPDGGEKLREFLERGQTGQDRSKDRETTNGAEETTDDASRSPKNGQPTNLGEESGVYPFLALHRFMINTEIQYIQISLRQPYVLCNDTIPREPPASTPPESTSVVKKYLDARWFGPTVVPAVTTWAACIDYSTYPAERGVGYPVRGALHRKNSGFDFRRYQKVVPTTMSPGNSRMRQSRAERLSK